MCALRRHLDDIKKYVPEFIPEFIPEFVPEFVPEFGLNTDFYCGTNSGMNIFLCRLNGALFETSILAPHMVVQKYENISPNSLRVGTCRVRGKEQKYI